MALWGISTNSTPATSPHFPSLHCPCVRGLVVVRALDLRLRRSRVRLPASRFQVTTLGKLFTHTCLCHQAVYFGTGQGAVMPCGWEGNRRSGVALAMCHRLQWFIHLRAHGLRQGDKHPTCTPHGGMAHFMGITWVWHTFPLYQWPPLSPDTLDYCDRYFKG